MDIDNDKPGVELSPEERERLKQSEMVRLEAQREFALNNAQVGQPGGIWAILNSSFTIWFLSSVMLALIAHQCSSHAEHKRDQEAVRRLRYEVLTDAWEFIREIEHTELHSKACGVYREYLQYPRGKFAHPLPSMDARLMELRYRGGRADARDAARANDALVKIWQKGLHENCENDALTDQERDDIIRIVKSDIVTPFQSRGPFGGGGGRGGLIVVVLIVGGIAAWVLYRASNRSVGPSA